MFSTTIVWPLFNQKRKGSSTTRLLYCRLLPLSRRSFKFIFTFFELPIQIDIARRKQAPLAAE